MPVHVPCWFLLPSAALSQMPVVFSNTPPPPLLLILCQLCSSEHLYNRGIWGHLYHSKPLSSGFLFCDCCLSPITTWPLMPPYTSVPPTVCHRQADDEDLMTLGMDDDIRCAASVPALLAVGCAVLNRQGSHRLRVALQAPQPRRQLVMLHLERAALTAPGDCTLKAPLPPTLGWLVFK